MSAQTSVAVGMKGASKAMSAMNKVEQIIIFNVYMKTVATSSIGITWWCG